MPDEAEEKQEVRTKRVPRMADRLIAKRDFEIHHNQYHFCIKKGMDINKMDIPAHFHPNLKTEKVI